MNHRSAQDPALAARAAAMAASVPGCDPTVLDTWTVDPDAAGMPVSQKWGLCCIFGAFPCFWPFALCCVAPFLYSLARAGQEFVEQTQFVLTKTHLLRGWRDPNWRPKGKVMGAMVPVTGEVFAVASGEVLGATRQTDISCWNKGKPLHTLALRTRPGHPAAFAGGKRKKRCGTHTHYLIQLHFGAYDESRFERLAATFCH